MCCPNGPSNNRPKSPCMRVPETPSLPTRSGGVLVLARARLGFASLPCLLATLHFLDNQRSVTELIQLFQLAPLTSGHSDIYLALGGVHGTKTKTS